MSRYIDVEWLEDNAKEYSLGYYDYDEYAVPLSALDSAPSIDIVRCKECKYCVDEGAQRALVCDNSYIDMDIHPDDYCSYGERKESE